MEYIDIGNVDSSGQVNERATYKFAAAPSRARRKVEHGDVIISTVRTYLQAIAPIENPEDNLIVSTGFAVARPIRELLDAKYFKYALREPRFLNEVVARSTGMSYPAINASELADITVCVHELKNQRGIATYLDSETARIDALVTEKERMLFMLEQKRAALISHAVTRGLNPKAPTKPSGLNWLGEIPQHWNIRRVKYLIEALTQGSSPQASSFPAEANELGVLKLSAISRGRFHRSENKALRITEDEEIHPDSLSAGDVLVTRSNTPSRVGDACCVPEDEPNLLIPDLVYRLRVKRHFVMPEFLVNYLLTTSARTEIISDARGSSGTMVKISQDHVSNWKIPVPPVEEQEAIITHIQAHQSRSAALQSALRDSIALLKERRSALISAAVTGRLPVTI